MSAVGRVTYKRAKLQQVELMYDELLIFVRSLDPSVWLVAVLTCTAVILAALSL